MMRWMRYGVNVTIPVRFDPQSRRYIFGLVDGGFSSCGQPSLQLFWCHWCLEALFPLRIGHAIDAFLASAFVVDLQGFPIECLSDIPFRQTITTEVR